MHELIIMLIPLSMVIAVCHFAAQLDLPEVQSLQLERDKLLIAIDHIGKAQTLSEVHTILRRRGLYNGNG